MTTFTTGTGQTLHNVHTAVECMARLGITDHCPLHHPSPEAAAIGDTHWVDGVGMYRRCVHGYMHPDPDHQPMSVDGFAALEAMHSVHMVDEHCDGCCRPAVDEAGLPADDVGDR